MSKPRLISCLSLPVIVKWLLCGSVIILVACGKESKTDKAAVPAQKKQIEAVSSAPKVQPNKPIKAAQVIDGEKLYKRCAACHLPTGEGVPGAFPPLKGDLASLLESDAGKEYLVLAATYGVAGEMVVSDQKFVGVMPAQGGLNSEKTAAILNYIMQDLNGFNSEDDEVFTPEFVERTKAKHGRVSGRKVMELRGPAYESVR